MIAASLRLAEETPRIMDDIRLMQGVELPYKRQVDFVHEAARLRLGNDYEDRIRPEALLSPGAGTTLDLRRRSGYCLAVLQPGSGKPDPGRSSLEATEGRRLPPSFPAGAQRY